MSTEEIREEIEHVEKVVKRSLAPAVRTLIQIMEKIESALHTSRT